MKITVIGAGAIGGFVGARLALAGNTVSLVARGQTLTSLRKHGLVLQGCHGGTQRVALHAVTDQSKSLGVQDVVILAVKAHQLAAAAAAVSPLLGDHTVILPIQNGIPFWYFHEHGGPLQDTPLRSVDPEKLIANRLPIRHLLGCVIYASCLCPAPGVVQHLEGDRLPVAELNGHASERVTLVAQCLTEAGFNSAVLNDIRSEIWLKLWGNLSFNPVSALTRSPLKTLCEDAATRRLIATMMSEAQAVATALGVEFRMSIDQRIAGAARSKAPKTSMLLDVEASRPLEVDALLGSVIELGQLTRVPTPNLDVVYALARQLSVSLTPIR
jgi:2-dehydropantoate 2-reductase